MYLEGMGFRAIERVLKISYEIVFQWVNKWGKTWIYPSGMNQYG
jgi:transposase-like protein